MPENNFTRTGQRKIETAYKIRIGDIKRGNPVIESVPDGSLAGAGGSEEKSRGRERFRVLELDGKSIVKVNIIANVIDKYSKEGEKRFAALTLDDATGQIQARVFGDDISKFGSINQGDTLIVIGALRSFNQEIYILPEIVKKTDPRYLLIRKLELEKNSPEKIERTPEQKKEIQSMKDKIMNIIKSGDVQGGIDTEQIILQLSDISPEVINTEITKLLEDGVIYEPRPGRVRWLG